MVHSFLNNNLFFLAFIIIFSNFLVFFFDERGCGQAAEGGDLSRGEVPRDGFWEWFPSPILKMCANSNIKICKSGSWMCFYLSTSYCVNEAHNIYLY